MALFFDQQWFDAKLRERGLSKATLAAALRIDVAGIEAMWKDQREISGAEVAVMADFLGVGAKEIVERAGAATPLPDAADPMTQILARLDALEARLRQLENAQEALAQRPAAGKSS